MHSKKQVLKYLAAFMILAFLFAFSSGCSTSKEAIATPAPVASAPAFDQKKIEALMQRVESAAKMAEETAKKAELSAQKAEMAGNKAEKSATMAEQAAEKAENAAAKAETAANKAESIFMKKMKK